MRGKQRFEVIDPAALAPRTTEPVSEVQPTQIGGHAMGREEVIAADCVYGECDHDMDDECPTWEMDVCVECTAAEVAEVGDEACVTAWPCPKSSNRQEDSDA